MKNNKENMESKKNTISEFCQKYMEKSDEDKNAYLMSIINTEYISYLIRARVAEETVKKVCTFKDGVIQKNTVMNQINKAVSFFVIHSTLDFEKLPTMVIYDLLNKVDVIEPFCSALKKEWEEYTYIYDSMESDLYANNTTALSFFAKQVSRFANLVDNGLGKLADMMSHIDATKLGEKFGDMVGKAENAINDMKKNDEDITDETVVDETDKVVNINELKNDK